MFDDDDNVAAAMRHGAIGYLLKGARQEQIRRAHGRGSVLVP
jgi:DNA-binding NarL/FixJ family response regulator